MEEEEKYIDLLDRYYAESASNEDLMEIALLEGKYPEFLQLKEEYIKLIQGIHYTVRKSQIGKLKQIDDALGAPVLKISRLGNNFDSYKWLAAFISLMILGSAVWFLLPDRKKSEKLFNAYFQTYPNVAFILERGGAKDALTLEAEIFNAYQSGKFEESLVLIYQLPKEDINTSYEFYLGNIHLALNETDSALFYFGKVREKKEEFELQAKWYSALAHIRRGEYKKSHQLLEELSTMDNSYRKKSLRLLEATGGKTP